MLVLPLLWAISTDRRAVAVALGVLALVSDALDGMLARRYRAESELGRILDPLADKVLAAAVGLALLWRGALPLWYVTVVIGRDVLIVLGSIVMRARIRAVPPSLPIGKAAATSIGIVLLAAIAGIGEHIVAALAIASSVLLVWSFVVYGARLKRIIRPHQLSN